MLRKCGAVFAGLAAAVLCLSVNAADEKSPTIKEVMKAVGAKGGLCSQCNAAAKAEKWDEAQKLAKKMTECGAALAKNQCPKGDAESWAKLSKLYAEQTVAINKAAEAKDAKAFGKAIGAFTGSCKACHNAHK